MKLTFFLALAVLTSFVEAEVDSLTMIISPDCSLDEPCLDLDRALDNLTSDMTLQLLPGVHLVTRQHTQDTRGISNVRMVGSGPGLTTLHCNDQNGLAFVGMANMTLSNFTVTQCGLTGENLDFYVALLNETVDLLFIVPSAARIAVFIADCTDMTLQDITISDTAGLGLLGINILGNSKFSSVQFIRNIRPQCIDFVPGISSFLDAEFFNQIGGGAYFLYTDYYNSFESVNNANLTLEHCHFIKNGDCTYSAFIDINFSYNIIGHELFEYSIGGGGGLSVILASSFIGIDVSITDTVFRENDARYGAGAYVATFAGFQEHLSVVFTGCEFVENGVVESGDVLEQSYCWGGGGLAIFTDLLKPKHLGSGVSPFGSDLVIALVETEFVSNTAAIQGGAIMAYSLFNTPHSTRGFAYFIIWQLDNVTFYSNSARYGSAGHFKQKTAFGQDGTAIVQFSETTATSNKFLDQLVLDEETSVFELSDISSEFYGTNTLSHNIGSALHILSSIVILFPSARLIFINNTAHHGAGANFEGSQSGFILLSNTHLEFNGNKALVQGGAVYIDHTVIAPEILQPFNTFDCFIVSTPDILLGMGSTISFKNNHAPLGSMVYGSTLETCSWAKDVLRNGNLSLYETLHRDYNSTFMFDSNPIGEELVSTSPMYLLVDVLPDDKDTSFPIQAFPGQHIDIKIQVFDFFNRIIPAIVTSTVTPTGSVFSTLGGSGFWYTLVNRTTLSLAGTRTGILFVSILSTTNSLRYNFTVELLPCPIGFVIDGKTMTCQCDERLQNFDDFSCSSDSISFQSLLHVWVGVDPDVRNATTADIITHSCILNYCRVSNGNVTPPAFDSQCMKNRVGLICGECAEGFSNAFGSTDCVRCTHYWLLLIPVFAIAGAVLFAAVALLEITVDKGLTNALILFVSLLAVPNDIATYDDAFEYALLPVRLLSLQIGVTTCFYDGMTTLHRSFWYFVFPLYLFLLMGIFTCLTRRSSWLSVHFSPAKTLATLLSMCYFYTLTICLQILIPLKISYIDGHEETRWLEYPSQHYFRGLHAILGVMAIFVSLVYLIPYPLLLLSPTLSYKYLHRFSAYFDIMWAPYKPKLRFWLGVRILLLLIVYGVSRAPPPYGYSFTNTLLLLFSHLQTLLQPFKDKWANWADLVFMLLVLYYFMLIQVGQFTQQTGAIIFGSYATSGLLIIFGYAVVIAIFILLIHRQFPSLEHRLRTKLKGIVSKFKKRDKFLSPTQTVIESNSSDLVIGGSISQTSSPANLATSFTSIPRYRESLLSDSL